MPTLKTTISIPSIIRPFHDRLLVQRDELPKMKGDLDVSMKREKPNTGTIIIKGTSCLGLLDAKRIMFHRSSGTDLELNDQRILVLREQDCFLDLDTLQSFHDKVLIRPDPMPKEIKGIIIPDNVNEQPQSGTVLSVGDKCVETRVGERVMFGKFAGMLITPKDEELLTIREADIFAGL